MLGNYTRQFKYQHIYRFEKFLNLHVTYTLEIRGVLCCGVLFTDLFHINITIFLLHSALSCIFITVHELLSTIWDRGLG